MKLLFGDSHVDLLSQYVDDAEKHEWRFLSAGGASCAGILNVDSRSGARKEFDKFWQPGEHVVIMLGECDVVDLLPIVPSSLKKSMSRLLSFVKGLSAVGSCVTVCTMLPHTAGFTLYGVPAHDLRNSIEQWNSALPNKLDVYTPMLGHDRFLPDELCHTSGSTDERHLNKIGYLRVWDIIKTAI